MQNAPIATLPQLKPACSETPPQRRYPLGALMVASFAHLSLPNVSTVLAAVLFAISIGAPRSQAQAHSHHAVTHLLASVVKTDSARLAPTPKTGTQAVNFAEASSGRFADSAVSMTGTLVSQVHDANSSTLILDVEGHLVSASLEQAVPLDDNQPGSVLQVSGLCRVVPGGTERAPHLSHIEMRSPADLQVISRPSWFSIEHVLAVLIAVMLVTLALLIRSSLLNWHAKSQNAWISRFTVIARERSRILEMIGSNHGLDELLDATCKSIMHLLPGATCFYHLELDIESPVTRGETQSLESRGTTVYEVVLRDDAEKVTGKILVTSTNPDALPTDREEIFSLLSELAGLAMRQSLLYRELVYHSTHDPLTELPNRRLCESRLATALSEAEMTAGQLAVIYIDINRFKFVNDKYGHKIGDLYLQQISSRLRSQLRTIDMLARVGGDEFVVIAPFPEGFDRVYALTARLEACFDEEFILEDQRIEGSASFGFARYPEHGLTAEELTRHADHAMYIAKHEDRISEEAHALSIITPDELELALIRRRFRLAYQPQFSATGRLTGLEALLRLDDPVLGLITPDAFISVAEKHAVIVGIGEWALRTALQDANRWNLNQGEPISLAVNVSIRQLEEPNYAESVLAILEENDFQPERLEIELIERSLMFSGDVVLQQLELLRAAGVRVSLDDFGTEQSCLSVLHKLPIDTIKLDRSFIRAMDNEPGVLPIIQAIVSMAHSLGKRVVAEAIEHVGPVPLLMKMGKMDFQGYLLSRPIPSEDVPTFMQSWRAGIDMPDAFREPIRRGIKRIA